MSLIRTFFELNQPIILFGYGLTFFTMGLAIALQSRRYSRPELARSLAWLAAFGIIHSLYEWGELFAPVHEAYLTPRGIELLHSLHLVLLSASFACLFAFGAALLSTLKRGQWLGRVSALLLAVYFFVVLFALPRLLPDPHQWHNAANALARYFIGFPGALLAAYSLREQTFRYIAPLNVPHIIATLRIAGVALALYSIFGGLIPPPVPFFPGNILNDSTFVQTLGVPPLVFHSIIGLTLAVTIIRALEIFEVETERRIEAMEQQQILAAERNRIGRELHDGAIQTVYTAGLLVESARKLAAPETLLAGRLDKAIAVLNDAICDLRRNLSDLRPAPSAQSLAGALRNLSEDPRFRSLVDVSLTLDVPEVETLSPARTDHVLAIVGEALSNVVRHARARRVNISAHRADGQLAVTIQDDGIGLSSEPEAGYGLRNMRDRARLLGGQLEVAGESGKGTAVSLTVPWKDER
ncbi:MAG: sensor histidine kinase [Chloroflexota bacterium]